jgi:hypothetical protein
VIENPEVRGAAARRHRELIFVVKALMFVVIAGMITATVGWVPLGWKLLSVVIVLGISSMLPLFLPKRLWRKRGLYCGWFVLDMVLVAVGLFLSSGGQFGLLLVYFIAMYIGAASSGMGYAVGSSTVLIMLYVFLLASTSSLEEVLQPSVLLSIPLIVTTATFANWLRQQVS